MNNGKILIELSNKFILVNGMNDIKEIKTDKNCVSCILNDIFYTTYMNKNVIYLEKYSF